MLKRAKLDTKRSPAYLRGIETSCLPVFRFPFAVSTYLRGIDEARRRRAADYCVSSLQRN